MFLRYPRNPLIDILGTFTDSFLQLGLTEFTICEEPNFYIIKAKQDWLRQNNNKELDYYFNEIVHINSSSNVLPIQAEVFLTAFYFQFYTTGDAGEYGNSKLFEKCYGENTSEELERYGRILIIFKDQQLPKNHGINFEQPERTISDLENERKWLDLAIKQAKLNEKNP